MTGAHSSKKHNSSDFGSNTLNEIVHLANAEVQNNILRGTGGAYGRWEVSQSITFPSTVPSHE